MKRIISFAFLSVLMILTAFSSVASARVDIVPRKIVMDTRDRSAEITILNLFDKEGTFRIDLVSNKQNEDGTYTVLDHDLDVNFDPSKIARFSPRQFTLPSKGRQKVRISLRKPAELPEGEYRFHVKALRFAALDGADNKEASSGTSVSMLMNIGVTIPVIVRNGALESSAKIRDVRLVSSSKSKTGKNELQMVIEREGNKSTIGSLSAFWEPSGSVEADRIGYIDNMNIFTDINKRYVNLPLRYIPKGSGAIRLRYVNNGLDKGAVYDELLLDQ